MIKAVFFDVDGTLFSHKTKKVPDSAVKGINALRDNGIKVFLSTGRHITELRKVDLRGLKFDGYITTNGQICLDENEEYLAGNPFDKESLDFVLSIFNKKEMPIVVVDASRIYLNVVNDIVKKAQAALSAPVPILGEYLGGDLFQASTYLKQEDEDEFIKTMPSSCKLARWSCWGVDIITAIGGKSKGISYFMDKFGIKKDETMAFGDAPNDIDMLSAVSIGVAMGNAVDELKKIATYVTDDIDNDGIYKALKHFGLV